MREGAGRQQPGGQDRTLSSHVHPSTLASIPSAIQTQQENEKERELKEQGLPVKGSWKYPPLSLSTKKKLLKSLQIMPKLLTKMHPLKTLIPWEEGLDEFITK